MRPLQLKGHQRPITLVKFNREGDLLFSCARDQTPTLWSATTGERIGSYVGHNGAVLSCDVNYESTVLLTGSGDTSVKIWDVETGKERQSLSHKAPVRWVEWAEGDKQFLTLTDAVMGQTTTILIYSFEPGRAVVVGEISLPNIKLSQASWGPLNKTIITAGEDGSVRVYDVETKKLIQESKEHTKPITRISFDKFKFTFITASKDCTVRLYDTKTLQVLKIYDTGRPVNAASISPLKDHVVLGGGQSAEAVTTSRADSSQFRLRFFHKIFAEELGSVPGHFGPVNTLAFSPDGRSFVSGGEDGYVRIHHFDPSYFTEED